MMNKYTLGTIVGTALLGLAKKSSGSSAKIGKFSIYTIEYSFSFGIDNNFYWDLMDNPQLKNDLFDGFYQKLSDIDSVDVYLNLYPDPEDLDDEDYQEENRGYIEGYITLTVSVNFRSNSIFGLTTDFEDPGTVSKRIFDIERNKFIDYMREEWQLNSNWEAQNTRTYYKYGIFVKQNGDWVPYNPKKPSPSKLRRR